MDRKDILLSALARGAAIRPFEPVHVQKAMFLVDRHAREMFDVGSRYTFTPYDYGPFDSSVYADLDVLKTGGMVEVERESGYGYRVYRATPAGIEQGNAIAARLDAPHRQLVEQIVDTILPLSFRQLVSAVYKTYPDMKVNSVFND